MPITDIITAKELNRAFSPILLAEITFADATVLRMCTRDFRTATTGVQYGGHDYLPQILNQEAAAIQILQSDGIDGIPSVTLSLADADRFIWTNYELTKGFKGATLVLRFVFVDFNTATFSSDSMVKFTGLCDPPNVDEDTMTLQAVSKLNMTRAIAPTVMIQRTDPHPFPNTHADRVAAFWDNSSQFYLSGYSVDVLDSDLPTWHPLYGITGTVVGFGNFNGGSTPYTSADYDGTYAKYLQIFGNGTDPLHDALGRHTGTFGGERWQPASTFTGKSYATGKTVYGSNPDNSGIYGQYVPLLYGTAQCTPIIVSAISDANSERGEAIVCMGAVTSVVNNEIILNNTILPAATDIEGNAIHVNDPLARFNVINRGYRNGQRLNGDALFNNQGDVHGGMFVIEYCAYNQIAASGSFPNITMVVQGPPVRVYTDPDTFTEIYSANPAWCMMAFFVQCSALIYDDFDIQTFIDAAAVCDRTVTYTKVDGTSASHPLFETSLYIKDKKTVADYIKPFRTSFRGTLVPNSANNGKLQLYVDQTLADQNPAPIAGSNYNIAVASIDHTGASADGYVAYAFSDTNGTILRNGTKSTLKITQTGINATPNALQFQFNDSENYYNIDADNVVSAIDISRVHQTVNNSFSVAGLQTYDQGQRIGSWWLSKSLAGNPRGDTGGTFHFTWQTNFKALHLRIGDIVLMNSAHDGIENALVRISSIKVAMDFETVTLEGDWHVDEFYEDNFGQPGFRGSAINRAQEKPPFPWLPNELAPANTADPIIPQTNKNFNVAQAYPFDASKRVLPTLTVIAKEPVNNFSTTAKQPNVRPAFNVNPTGGILKCGFTYSLCLCGTDSNGFSIPSYTVNVPIASGGTNTNSIELTDISWNGNTNYTLFAGVDPQKMCWQGDAAITTAPTLTNLIDQSYGVPSVYDSLCVYVKHIEHSGLIGDPVKAVTSTTIQLTDGGFTTDQFVGRTASILGSAADMNQLKVLNYLITGNTSDTLTVDGNPSSDGVGVGDALTICTLATTHTSNTIGDSQFINSYAPSGLTPGAERGNQIRITSGTGANQPLKTIISNTATVLTIQGTFDVTPDATSSFIIEDPTWLARIQSTSQNNSDPNATLELDLPIPNYLGETLLVQIGTVSADGRESLPNKDVYRQMYVFGVKQPVAQLCAQFQWDSGNTDMIVGDTTVSGSNPNPGTLVGWDARADGPPTGSTALEVDILLNDVSIFGTFGAPFCFVPPGSTALQTGDASTFDAVYTIVQGDKLQAIVRQVGDTDPGKSMSINLYAALPLT